MMQDKREYLPDGDELRRRRQLLGLSQREMAKLIGTTQSRVSYAETGAVPVGDVARRRYVAVLEEYERKQKR